MELLHVIVHRSECDALFADLMRLRCLQIVQTALPDVQLRAWQSDNDQIAETAARLNAVLTRLAPYATERRRPFSAPVAVDRAAFCKEGREERSLRALKETERLFAERDALQEQCERAYAEMRALLPFLDWGRPLDFAGTATTAVELGMLPAGTEADAVLRAMENRAAVAQIVCDDKTGLYLSLIVHRQDRDATLCSLGEIGFTSAHFSATDGTAKVLFDRADDARARLESDIARIDRQLTALAERIGDLQITADILASCRQAKAYLKNAAETGRCAVMRFWCPKHERARVAALLDSFDAAYEFRAPEASEEAPVLAKTARPLRPFAALFGTDRAPLCRRFDPTLVIALLYCLCFGLFFADAGYGLLLAAASLLTYRFVYLPRPASRVLLLFGACGISATLFGILQGHYFGALPSRLFAEVPSLALLPEAALAVFGRFSAAGNPLFAVRAAVLGIGVYATALMVARIVSLCRGQKALSALLDVGSYLLLTLGVMLVAVVPLLPWFVGVGTLVLGALAVLFTQGRTAACFGERMKDGARGFLRPVGYGALLLPYFCAPTSLCLSAAVIGTLAHFLPLLTAAPMVGLGLALFALALSVLLCYGAQRLLVFAHANGMPYADASARVCEQLPPAFCPMKPVEHYGVDATPIRTKREVKSDDRT